MTTVRRSKRPIKTDSVSVPRRNGTYSVYFKHRVLSYFFIRQNANLRTKANGEYRHRVGAG